MVEPKDPVVFPNHSLCIHYVWVPVGCPALKKPIIGVSVGCGYLSDGCLDLEVGRDTQNVEIHEFLRNFEQ